ncbi:MAG: glycosyltransferase family 4 protein [bacterium]|nr:glycosyltransferase family 4 protein [bacterium]
MKKLRILIVHNTYKIPGGEDSVVSNEMQLLRDAGHEVFFYQKNNTELDSYSLFQKLLLPFRAVYSRKTYREVRGLIKTHRIDLVHVHNTLLIISPSVYDAARSLGVPVIQTIHNYRLLCPNALFLRNGHICQDCLSNGLSQAVKHACYRGSRAQTLIVSLMLAYHRRRGTYNRLTYVCLTEFNKNMLLRLSLRGKSLLSPQQIDIKPNFTPDPGCPVPYAKRQPYFLFASRMDVSKGIFVLLQAWELYEKSNIHPKELFLCSSGPAEDAVHSYIQTHGLSHVTPLGQLSHDEVLAKMKYALAVCLPTQWYEGFPVVIAESFACGTPVIGSKIGNVGTLVRHGETGLTHAPADAETLADFFLHWGENSEAAQAMSINARKTYEACYTPDKNLEMLTGIYKKVLEQNAMEESL